MNTNKCIILFSRNGHCISKLEVVTSFRVKKNPIHNFAVQEKLTAHDWPVTVPNNVFHVGVIVSFGHLIPENIINKFPLLALCGAT